MLLPVYYAVLGTLALYGLHRLVLLLVLRLSRPPVDGEGGAGDSAGVQDSAQAEPVWPLVTVQLPIYNERYVAPRLIAAVLDFDYPADRLEVQILDDSTDDTADRVQAELVRASGRNRPLPLIRHLRRESRQGFKAGALAAGLEQARGELIAIFDADFVPEPDFLQRTVPAFRDPGLGMVQACWGHMNRQDSLLTRAQAVLLDGHFLVEQAARYQAGCFFNFNGTAGVWRRRAIDDAGGWQVDTLTEDLDLSYRAQLAGWRFRLMTDLAVPAELPARVNDFKSQQHRWARGSAQTMRKLLGRILRSAVRPRVKLAAAAHLTSGICYPLLVALGLLLLPAILARQESPHLLLWIDAPLFLLGTVAVAGCYAAGQRRAGRRGSRFWFEVPLAMSIGIGLSLHNSAATLSGLLRRGGVFARTPKIPAAARNPPALYRSGAVWSLWGEATLALYFWVCVAAAGLYGRWWSLPFLYLFAQGYSLIALGGALPRLGRRAETT
ncbi:MAG: glycosyltransferase [Acidobacteriota bacterium]|nr:glycosyltransferase [Acidobacteriota bacterium]